MTADRPTMVVAQCRGKCFFAAVDSRQVAAILRHLDEATARDGTTLHDAQQWALNALILEKYKSKEDARCVAETLLWIACRMPTTVRGGLERLALKGGVAIRCSVIDEGPINDGTGDEPCLLEFSFRVAMPEELAKKFPSSALPSLGGPPLKH